MYVSMYVCTYSVCTYVRVKVRSVMRGTYIFSDVAAHKHRKRKRKAQGLQEFTSFVHMTLHRNRPEV